MNKKIVVVLMIAVMLFNCSASLAAYNPPNTPNADPVFDSITTTLSTYKTAAFSAYTNDIVGYIKIAACWLQKKVDNSWVYVCLLPKPTYIEYNTIGYSDYLDYSNYIPTDGNTYRIGVRWEADGHFVTRYSNQRTF